MSMRYLGASFDLHTGGIDLVFPHHEDEIAQSEAATGQPFVGTWMHCAHLQMGGEKMAKRSGNFARPADVYAGGISPQALRFALLATHYRSPLEFSDASLAHASAAVERFGTAVTALEAYAEERPDDAAMAQLLADGRAGFAAGLEDRSQHLGGTGGALRACPRAQQQGRCSLTLECRRTSGSLPIARARQRPRSPRRRHPRAATGTGDAARGSSGRASTAGLGSQRHTAR